MQRQFGLDVDCMSSKERWAWPRHSMPTDRPAVERDSRDTGNKVFLLVGLKGEEKKKTSGDFSQVFVGCWNAIT